MKRMAVVKPRAPVGSRAALSRRTVLALCAAWAAPALIEHWTLIQSMQAAMPYGSDSVGAWASSLVQLVDPFSWRGFGTALAGHAGGTLAVAAFLAAGLGAGASPLRWMYRLRPPVAAVAPLGFVALSLAVQGLGLAGLLCAPVIGPVLAVAGLAGLATVWGSRRVIRDALRQFPLEGFWLLGLFAACVLVARLPQGSEDPLQYHWAAPEHYLLLHRIVATPSVSNWNVPLQVEMLYAPALLFLGMEGARLVNVALLFAIAIVVWALAGGRERGRGAVWAAWVTAGSLLMLSTVSTGKNDLGIALYVPLVLAGIFLPLGEAWWPVAGVFAGAALAAKTVSVLVLGGAGAAALLVWRRVPGGIWRGIAGAAAVGLPWFLQLWWFSSNPFYPFSVPVFHDSWWEPAEAAALKTYFRSFAPPILFQPAGISAVLMGVLNSSLALGIAVPFVFVLRPPAASRDTRGFAIVRLAIPLAFALWILAVRIPRYLNPLVPLVAAVCARELWGQSGRRRTAAAILGALQFVACLVFFLPDLAGPGKVAYLLGQRTRAEAVADESTTMDTARRWVNAHLSARDGILLMGEERRFGYRPRVVSSLLSDQKLVWRWTRESATPGEVRKKARQWGVTHLLFNFVSAEYRAIVWYAGRPWDDRQLVLYRAFLDRYARQAWRSPVIEYTNGGYCLWRLEARPDAPEAFVPWYLPGTEGLFNGVSSPWKIAGHPVSEAEYLGWYEATAARVPGVGFGLQQLAQAYDAVKNVDRTSALVERLYRMGYPGGGTGHAYAMLLRSSGRDDEAVRVASGEIRRFNQRETRDLVAAALFEKALRDGKAGWRRRALMEMDASAGVAARSPEVCLAFARGYAQLGNGLRARRFLAMAVEAGSHGKETDDIAAAVAALRP